jgi:hypothetical protein
MNSGTSAVLHTRSRGSVIIIIIIIIIILLSSIGLVLDPGVKSARPVVTDRHAMTSGR